MKLNPARQINGHLQLPGDKSISHRAALIAALAAGSSEITNFSSARDCASTVTCLGELGISIEQTADKLTFKGGEKLVAPQRPLDCGNSGSTLRILTGVLAGHDLTAELVGDESLSSRPMRRIIEPLELMGAKIESTDGKAPLKVHGSAKLTPITYKIPVASAQVKSAILFAGLNATGETTVIESSLTRDHTERLFAGFGAPIRTNQDLSKTLTGPARLNGGSITIPGDISSAAYFMAAAMLLPGSDLTIENVGVNPTRAVFLGGLSSWGGEIRATNMQIERNESFGTITVRGGLSRKAGERERTL